MSQIGQNIRKLRQVKGLSQQAFAEIFELTRGNISSYEEKRAEPKIDVVAKIANHFSIPLQDLLNKNLSVNEILNFNAHFEPKEVTIHSDLKIIPFLDRYYLPQVADYYNKVSALPKIHFPIFSPKDFLAVELHEAIDHHPDFKYKESDIGFFKALEVDLLHTVESAFGLLYSENQFIIGQFHIENDKIFLELNQWHREEIDPNDMKNFWKLYGKFEKAF